MPSEEPKLHTWPFLKKAVALVRYMCPLWTLYLVSSCLIFFFLGYHGQKKIKVYWQAFLSKFTYTLYLQKFHRERSGSVVEWWTRDRRAAGSSLTGVTVLCPLSKNINPSLVLVQPRKTCPFKTERLLMGRKE